VKKLVVGILAFLGRATLVLIVLAIVGGALTVWWFRNRAREAQRPPVTEVALPRGTRAIELWFPQSVGGGLELETREVVEDDAQGEKVVRTVVGALLDGPENAGLARSFPEGVTLSHVYRDPGGGLYLDFSNQLRLSFRGGSTAEELRKLKEQMYAMLKDGGPAPTGKWADYEAFIPVRDFKARHASTLLTFDAVTDAIAQIEAKAEAL